MLLAISALGSIGLAFGGEPQDLCRVLANPQNFAGKLITFRASVIATMHGTYLKQPGCSDSVFMALPQEIPNYHGSVRPVTDAPFNAFLKARSDFQPDAPTFEATFSGQLEYSRRPRFGYYKRHRTRFVLQSVDAVANDH
jgi:hypothetical protein